MRWIVIDIVVGDTMPKDHEGLAKIVNDLGEQVSPIMKKSWCNEIANEHNRCIRMCLTA